MNQLVIIAGPCAVESRDQILSLAHELKRRGVTMLRGGAFKPRTSPHSFQGLEEEALKHLAEARKQTGLPIVTEVMGPEEIELVARYADVLQIGARNMHNYDLLKKLAQRAPTKTLLLKRGIQATKKELLGALEYLRVYGHTGEILVCERGIRTFANGEYDRFTLDVGFIADLKRDATFPYKVLVDPSHAAGRADLVEPLAYAGIAAGADGLLVEVKLSSKDVPLSDANQAITLETFDHILKMVYVICTERKDA